VRVTEVDLSHKSLNSGDVFILDAGLKLYQWNGSKAGPLEKMKGAQLSRALADERKGLPRINVLEESGKDLSEFWAAIGGQGAVKSAEEGGDDLEHEKATEKRLFQLSDASGKMEFKEVGKGPTVKRSLLDSNDVFILDTGAEVFAWIGKGASKDEKKKAMQFAQEYLAKHNRPLFTPIARILEGGANETFESSFT